MLARQRGCVAFQLFDAEQLGTQQLGVLVVAQRMACACR